jgi:hypothetical protein
MVRPLRISFVRGGLMTLCVRAQDNVAFTQRLARECFTSCVHSFGRRDLTRDEQHCVDTCVGKIM